MRIVKIALAAALGLLLATGCEDPNYVPREEYNTLLKEYQELQAGSKAIREEYAAQAQSVDRILQQLSQISGSTLSLRSDIEQGKGEMTQVEKIESGLDKIKTQMGQLDALTKDNKQLKGMVASLKKVIAEKEKEIEQLKEEIRKRDETITRQDQTIAEQSGTIANQNLTINVQKENLKALLAEQAQMLFQAGVDFEQLGDDAPDVSFMRNRRKIADYQDSMYEKAILYYKQALAAGYPQAANRISQVEEKLAH